MGKYFGPTCPYCKCPVQDMPHSYNSLLTDMGYDEYKHSCIYEFNHFFVATTISNNINSWRLGNNFISEVYKEMLWVFDYKKLTRYDVVKYKDSDLMTIAAVNIDGNGYQIIDFSKPVIISLDKSLFDWYKIPSSKFLETVKFLLTFK